MNKVSEKVRIVIEVNRDVRDRFNEIAHELGYKSSLLGRNLVQEFIEQHERGHRHE